MTPFRRWIAFATVGALGFLVQAVALMAMTRAGAHYLAATAGAVEIAVLHNFLWHERWTWRDRPASGRRQRLARLAAFHLTNGLVSIAGNLIIVFLLVRAFGSNVIVANLASMTVTAVMNFVAGDRVVFATPRWLHLFGSTAARAGLVALLLVATVTPVSAAELKPETVAAWNEYARAIEARLEQQRQAGLQAERPPDHLDDPRDAIDGEIVEVPNGLIHHWRGRVLLPGATLEQVLAAVDSPDRISKRQGDVLAARVLERHGSRMWLFLKVTRKSLITVTYNTEYAIDLQRDSARSAWSRSIATRIVELEDAGTPQEREKPEGHDWGLLWRLNAYWRYTQVDEGVLAELETISLSRDIPPGLGLIARPVIEREARQSIAKTLAALRDEVSAVTTIGADDGSENRR